MSGVFFWGDGRGRAGGMGGREGERGKGQGTSRQVVLWVPQLNANN